VDRTRRIDSNFHLSLRHKSVAELAAGAPAVLANSSAGADRSDRVPLALESVAYAPHDPGLSHDSPVLSYGNGLLVPLILSVIFLRQYLAHRNSKTLLELALTAALFVVSLIFLISHQPHSEMHTFNLWKVLRGVCLVLANPFLDLSLSPPDHLAGSLVLTILISLVPASFFVLLVLRGRKNEALESPLYSIGFALASWAVICSAMIAGARGGLDWRVWRSRVISRTRCSCRLG
jgi:hypothetical protein